MVCRRRELQLKWASVGWCDLWDALYKDLDKGYVLLQGYCDTAHANVHLWFWRLLLTPSMSHKPDTSRKFQGQGPSLRISNSVAPPSGPLSPAASPRLALKCPWTWVSLTKEESRFLSKRTRKWYLLSVQVSLSSSEHMNHLNNARLLMVVI